MIGWFKKLLFIYTKRNSVITKIYGKIYEDIRIDESYWNNPTFATDVP